MRLLSVYQDERLASSRVRVLQMQPHLAAVGVTAECVPYPSGVFALRRVLRRARDFDAVLLQKKLPSFADALLWRTLSVPFIYDFDDAVMLRQTPKNGQWASGTRSRRFERVTRIASAVSSGNSWLGQCAGRAPNVIPSPVPLPDAVHVHRESERPVIGWIGGKGNLASLQDLAPALQTLAARRDFVLRVIADVDHALEGVSVENVRWSLETQEAELAQLDVGLMPLEDTPWSRGKCSYKLLQYMASGALAVGSAVGMNNEVIANGKNGLLVDAGADWAAVLERALDDLPMRTALAAAGRSTVEERYTYEVCAGLWRKLFDGL